MEINLLQAQSNKEPAVLPEELVAARTKPRAQQNRRCGIQLRYTSTDVRPRGFSSVSAAIPIPKQRFCVTNRRTSARTTRIERKHCLVGNKHTVKQRFTVECKTRSRPSRAAFKLGPKQLSPGSDQTHPSRQKQNESATGSTATLARHKPPKDQQEEGCRLHQTTPQLSKIFHHESPRSIRNASHRFAGKYETTTPRSANPHAASGVFAGCERCSEMIIFDHLNVTGQASPRIGPSSRS